MTLETQAPILASALAIMNNPMISPEGRLNAAQDVIAELCLMIREQDSMIANGFPRWAPEQPAATPKPPREAILIPGEQAP